MKALGLVVEYNPFHNGHLYHLQESRKSSGADIVIAVMSGNFLQRGEPALVSKWTRAEMALKAGVDLVVELPYAFATQRADRFAYGAISLLDALHTDEVIFGSESGDIDPFLQTAEFLEEHDKQYNDRIQQEMKTGVSYPTAASNAFVKLPNRPEHTVDLTKPNNILGYHYINAVRKLNSTMKVETVKRTGAGYHDVDAPNRIASATGIRKGIFESGDLQSVQNLVPVTTYGMLQEHYTRVGHFNRWENYFGFLKHRLITTSPKDLVDIYECVEGLENRLQEKIERADTFRQFIDDVKTKRYTWTRIQRLCTHILTNAHQSIMKQALTEAPTYIRVLGMSELGQIYLNSVKKNVDLPIVSTISKYSDPFFSMDIQAAKTYILGFPSQFHTKLLKEEYSTPPLRFIKNSFVK